MPIQDQSNIFVKNAKAQFGGDALIVNQVKIHGTLYVPGNVVVDAKPNPGELRVGVIHLIVYANSKIIFLCKLFSAMQNLQNLYISMVIFCVFFVSVVF